MAWKRGDQDLKTPEIEDLLEAIIAEAGQKLDLVKIDPEAVKQSEASVRDVLKAATEKASAMLGMTGSIIDRDRVIDHVLRELAGFGPITSFLAEKTITEIMANGPGRIIVERNGVMEETRRKFHSNEHLLHIIRLMSSGIGRGIDEDNPFVDARLPDGSRLHAIIPPLAADGPALTIRKFSRSASSMADLVKNGAVPEEVAGFLHACVKGRLNILVSGGTNTGKTTMLNALAEAIPDTERVITIEDACELQFKKRNLVRLETKPPDMNGKGEIPTRILVRNALRMRPDRIVVGEVRGAESFDMLQAMNTGHSGSMTTVHANTARDALARVETTALLADVGLPLVAIRRQMSSAIHLIVHLERQSDGARRLAKMTEVIGTEGDVITTQDLFEMKAEKSGKDGSVTMTLRATGLVPKFDRILDERGIKVPRRIFEQSVGKG